MKYILSTTVLAILLLSSCRKDHSCGEPEPSCIHTKIDNFSNADCKTGNSSVKLYSFQGKAVYSFDMSSCGADIPIDIYDAECNYLGFLGGISGNTKINGVDFSTATYIRTIWPR